MRRDTGERVPDEAGFTLLEVLAAVAVAGFVLSAIGSIVATSLAGIRSTADRVTLTEAARTLLDGLPQGDALIPGTTTGSLGTTRWRIDVASADPRFNALRRPDGSPPAWTPAAIVISASTRSGRHLRIETAGLLRGSGR